jgi:hypothetical protein
LIPFINVTIPFSSSITKKAKYARVFIRNSPFQSGLIFESKAGSLPHRGVPESCPLSQAPAVVANIGLDWKGLPMPIIFSEL